MRVFFCYKTSPNTRDLPRPASSECNDVRIKLIKFSQMRNFGKHDIGGRV